MLCKRGQLWVGGLARTGCSCPESLFLSVPSASPPARTRLWPHHPSKSTGPWESLGHPGKNHVRTPCARVSAPLFPTVACRLRNADLRGVLSFTESDIRCDCICVKMALTDLCVQQPARAPQPPSSETAPGPCFQVNQRTGDRLRHLTLISERLCLTT